MKKETFQKALDNINDEYIDECAKTKKQRKPSVSRILAVAASLVLVVSGGFVMTKLFSDSENPDIGLSGKESNLSKFENLVVCTAEYPKGYSFNDYDARRKILDENPVEDKFYDSINNFSYKTASQLLKDKNENVMYSPLSLYYALAIATSGSKGETQSQLLKLLNVNDNEFLSQQCSNFYRLLYKDNEYSKLKIANSLWLDNEVDGNKVEFKNDFINNSKNNFYASMFSVDFSSNETGEIMKKWISDNTNGTLEYEFNPDPAQIMSIINTVYFYDEWVNKFDETKTKKDTFYISDKEKTECNFMNNELCSSSYTKGDGYLRSSIDLKNDGNMVFILPDEGVSVNQLLSSPEKINEIFNGGERKSGTVTWKIPKFSYGTSFDIKDSLQALGVTSPFSCDANFKGITDANAWISNIKQKTHIAIDENGVEASAYTEIMYAGAAFSEDKAEMILNRPFIYGITANKGNLLFIGVCQNPMVK